MVAPVLWIGGALAVGWALKQGGDAAESGAQLTKWAVIGGGVYVSWHALKAAGAIR